MSNASSVRSQGASPSRNGQIVRFRRGQVCPICEGNEEDHRGQGTRCFGFLSGEWVHCSREEHAGKARFHPESKTYSHKASGPCPCGQEHAPGDDESSGSGRTGRTIDCIYQYREPAGKVLHETVRYKDPKKFSQRRPIGNGEYVWSLKGITPVLYRLPELLAADPALPVWIAEGEKDVENLRAKGQVSTCNPMGALKWRDHYSESLRGRTCYILPDNDEDGRKHAQQVAQSLQGKAALVQIVEISDLPAKGDVSDFLAAGGTVEQLHALAARPPDLDLSRQSRLSRTRTGDDEEIPIAMPDWPKPPGKAAYQGLVGDIVGALEPETEGDPAACLFQFLVTFGNIVGMKPYVRLGGGFHHAKENALVVGRSGFGGRKGQSLEDTLPFFPEADPDWWKNCRAGGLSTGEGLIYRVRDPVEGVHHVKEKGRIVDTQTVIVDQGVADKRLLVVETEFGGVLKKASRDGNSLTATLRQAFDGATLSTLTKGSPYKATGTHISVVAHITPEEFLKLLAEVDLANGFINRFLLCMARRSRLLPFGGSIAPDRMAQLRDRLAKAIEFAKGVDQVTWARDAMDKWEGEYARLTADRPGAFGMATSRADVHTLRVALHYTLLDRCRQIQLRHLEAALEVWGYAERSAAYIFGDSTGDRDADRILEALRAAPQGMTRTEIRRIVFGDNPPAEKVASKLAFLLRLNLVRRESIETGGRPAERWFAGIRDVHVKDVLNVETPDGSPDASPVSPRDVHVKDVKDVESPPDAVSPGVTDHRNLDDHPF
jgi:hypothetical protein